MNQERAFERIDDEFVGSVLVPNPNMRVETPADEPE